MADQIVYLNLPNRTPTVAGTPSPEVTIGRQYQVSNDELSDELHGLCGGLDYCTRHGRVLPVSREHCYLWDVDVELTEEELQLSSDGSAAISLTPTCNVITSQFVLSHGSLSEPHIIDQDSAPTLTTTASFCFAVSTAMPAARIGILNLVETQRFAMLENGERSTLRDSGETEPVLYVPAPVNNTEVPSPIIDIANGTQSIQHSHDITLTQPLPALLDGSVIETLTVLEQYTTYFMQRELPFTRQNIWTPVCPPITWGWSMRVAKRRDGDWCIVRQKLLMPTVGHNGLEMPVWEGNQLGG